MVECGSSAKEEPGAGQVANHVQPPPASTISSSEPPVPDEPPQWERVLWRRQPFPDNYVPPSFLAELTARPALPVSQHMAVIALFLAVYYGMLEGTLSPTGVGWSCAMIGLVAYALWRIGWETKGKDEHPSGPDSAIRPLLLPPLLLSLLSPVLGTLTSATTSDTIWPLAGMLFFVHLLLSDFSTGPDARKRRRRRRKRANSGVSGMVAVAEEQNTLTSALSASVVLASRLPSTAHVFSLVMLAAGLFAGWPTLAKGVRESGKRFSIALTSSMIWLGCSMLPSFATIVTFLAILAVVNLGGPLMLWYAWRWKRQLGGDWDVAVMNRLISDWCPEKDSVGTI
ncbi:hypothetical protein A1Q1_04281 [Trichosporon asahii var. asahii CBS 2479]|uniref:Phosphatidylinositol N-acetylglucosaminyltransferase n=1 Tax=Trichosporon asahii var. asahii (strain ATCC 90039 / CBS 2479 / JCM 2466 / KCTC 7840 / NBRC 103889/ NCYC 2677 / UAMH 7654) TaxID=1186058 RepID=J5QF82_TRIAS|nr:hypothetical protein A1Q1_04281 [Trichosporon asahii var. asahii CBS 2479]EJT47038.1 hypothetical protein A1Q1_04281 [Trichosporon asahii var. asahii CBS 2479]